MDVIITGRMSSKRVPGKALYPLAGEPLIKRLVDKCRKLKHVNRIIMSTSNEKDDNPIQRFCEKHDIPCFRGAKTDVWNRHMSTFWHYSTTHAISIGADQLFFDLDLAQESINTALEHPGFELYRPYIKKHYPFTNHMPEYDVFSGATPPDDPTPENVLLGQTNYWIETKKFVKRANQLIYMHQARDWLRGSPHKHIAGPMGSPRFFNVKWFDVSHLMPSQTVVGGMPTMKISLDFPLQMLLADEIIKFLGRTPDTFADIHEAYAGIKEWSTP